MSGYPASTALLMTLLPLADANALRLQGKLVALNTASAAGPVPRSSVLDVLTDLGVAISSFNAAAAPAGMAAFAQAQKGNPTLDVATTFSAMLSACQALQSWIVANFPKDAGTGAWIVETYDANGAKTILTFTTADLATFRTNAAAVIATIG